MFKRIFIKTVFLLFLSSNMFANANDVAGLSAHPALRRVEVDTPTGPVKIAAPPATVNGETRELGSVPGIGDQTDQIRKEFSQ